MIENYFIIGLFNNLKPRLVDIIFKNSLRTSQKTLTRYKDQLVLCC